MDTSSDVRPRLIRQVQEPLGFYLRPSRNDHRVLSQLLDPEYDGWRFTLGEMARTEPGTPHAAVPRRRILRQRSPRIATDVLPKRR